MGPVTADTVRAARANLAQHGLLKDGNFGELGGPCCTIGHVRALRRPTLSLLDECASAWGRWRRAEGLSAEMSVVAWNDGIATPADVDRFYDWWINRLEGSQ